MRARTRMDVACQFDELANRLRHSKVLGEEPGFTCTDFVEDVLVEFTDAFTFGRASLGQVVIEPDTDRTYVDVPGDMTNPRLLIVLCPRCADYAARRGWTAPPKGRMT